MEWLLASIMPTFGLSTLYETLFYLQESAKLLILGLIIEVGRRVCQWLVERFKFRELHLLTELRVATNCNVIFRVFLVGAVR